ncbi:root hair defective 3 GTP-binding protein [Piromyces finnis]|uniref:Root hair defective 3 GTP-binding protein n=1 Tax=Piromyces finnis TaxID=1754191 RepID=A0A1Y1VIC3_9FUNG|nr:root hair defective 3 GTP-binding protein [Piromyces finnis]|eukprot:ORX57143.1 root hair defective 3 GTP-binding protein [Piromyces finnis]
MRVEDSMSSVYSYDELQLQLINDNKEFNTELGRFMKEKWNLAESGFDYNVVAVFGSQSTGKSTLLNRLFHTNFSVMDEQSRQQTTKGIWLSEARERPLLIMDVEGTDGRERGEEQDFERKSALFSLAISEVLIINMWENMVGLYQGANMGLLKTVLDVNLQLFQNKGAARTLLLFVIRDFVGVTPLKNLQKTIEDDMHKIWNELSKPENLQNSDISDFFDFMFIGLPHKVFKNEQFEKEVDLLKNRFYDKDDPNYVFKPDYHRRIPADGFPQYAQSIWDKVINNKDLDIPTQQHLLAQYRCEEIAKEENEIFLSKISPFKERLDNGEIIDNLGQDLLEFRDTAIKSFSVEGCRYRQDIYEKKKSDFLEQMNNTLYSYYTAQITNAQKAIVINFKEKFDDKVIDDNNDFKNTFDGLYENSLNEFQAVVDEITLPQTNWNSNEFIKKVKEELNTIGNNIRRKKVNEIRFTIDKSLRKEVVLCVRSALNENISENLWEDLFDKYGVIVEQNENKFINKATVYSCEENELKHISKELKKASWDAFYDTIFDETKDTLMIIRLKEKFESIFRYDSNGLPKVWKPGDDIDGQFQNSLNEAYKLCDLFNRIKIPLTKIKEITEVDNIDEDALEIIEPSKKKMLINRFRNTVEILYIDAKHSVVSTKAEIPYWMFIVIIVLGWNEFMAVLHNPVYFLLALIAGITVYALYRMNMIQPTLKIIRSILIDLGHQIINKLNAIENQNLLNERYEMYKQNYDNPNFMAEYEDSKRYSDMSGGSNSPSKPTQGHGLVQSSSLSHLTDTVHFIDNTEELDKQYEMNVNQIKRNKLLKRHTFQVPLNTKNRNYDDEDEDETDSYSFEMENLEKFDANNSENRSTLHRRV